MIGVRVVVVMMVILKKRHEEVDDLLEDMANDEPLPEPIRHRSSTVTDNITSAVHLLFVILASNLQDK